MKIYNIRYYQESDHQLFLDFINNHWRKNHIVATSQKIFDFQYKVDDRYTFVVAENTITGEFDGVYGYILTHKYDKTKSIPNIAWGAIWKVRTDVKNPEIASLGLKLLKFIIKHEDIHTFAVSGISEVNKKVSTGLGFKTGLLNHYYIANPSIESFNIAAYPEIKKSDKINNCILEYIDIDNAQIDKNDNPYKNVSYFVNRYANHPVYRYKFLGCFRDSKLKTIFAVRKQRVTDSNCLRIVDAIGDINGTGCLLTGFAKLLEQENSEYIDCLNYGICQDVFEMMGFSKLSGDTIIPEYFSPFEQRNVDVEILCMDPEEPIIIFKGDGDQDRPNSEIIEEY